MKADEQIYSMRTLKQQEMINRRKKTKIMIILIILLFILIFTANKAISSIKIQKQAKEYEKQAIEYSKEQKRIEEEKKEAEEKKKRENLVQITEKGKQNFETIYHSENKRVFLTFDDGPSTVTSIILQTLNEKGVKATFFVLGSNAEHNPDMIKKMYEQGHYIANHGYSHVYSQIYATPQSVLDEYNKSVTAIRNAIGEQEYNPHLFRFPGGLAGGKYAEIKKQAEVLLEQNDILHIDWNSLTGDSEKSKPTEDYLMNNLQKTTAGKNSLVVLMHDAQAKHITVETLPKVIDYLQQQGYTFKNFYEIIK